MTDIQLFSYPTSPYAQKVACYLKYKNLDFKFIPVIPLANGENEFLAHLSDGPFLGQQTTISLADLSAFPIVTSGHFMGIKTNQALKDHPEILAWAKRVHADLPANPLLVPDKLLRRYSL